jgi:hypothetical protein
MWRYAGCQKFEFGEQRPFINRKGEQTSEADWGLVVSSDWRIIGPDGFELSSEHFGEQRTDDHASSFYESLADGPVVVSIEVENNGELFFQMDRGYSLRVMHSPEAEADEDQWRLMPPGDDSPHLVLTKIGIERD